MSDRTDEYRAELLKCTLFKASAKAMAEGVVKFGKAMQHWETSHFSFNADTYYWTEGGSPDRARRPPTR